MTRPARWYAWLTIGTLIPLILGACAPTAPTPAQPAQATAAPQAKPASSPPASPASSPQAAGSPQASPASLPQQATGSPQASPQVAAPAAPVAAGPPTGEPVKLGFLGPLSPPGDPGAGQLISRGARIGVEYVNEVMGGVLGGPCGGSPRPLELVVADSSGQPEKGIAGYRKLVLDDKVVGVFGEAHSSVVVALGPVADQARVPMFSTFAGAGDITAKHFEYIFQSHSTVSARTAAAATFFKDAGIKKIAMLAENTDYGTDHIESMKQALATQGASDLEFRSWIFDRQTTDFGPILLQAKAFDPDVLYNVAAGGPIYLLAKQAADTGVSARSVHLISTDNPIRQEFWQNLGDLGKDVAFLSFYHPRQPLNELGEWAKQRYQQTFNEPIIYNPLGGFGNVVMYAQAINLACSTEGPEIVKALETGRLKSWNVNDASFPRAEGVDWHRLDQPILMVQYTEANQPYEDARILYPTAIRSGELVRPSR